MAVWSSAKDNKETIELRLNYCLNRYNYNAKDITFIRNFFWDMIGERAIPAIMIQLYSELGLYNKDDNMYYAHLNKIKKYFNVDCNILDVASGLLPAFANIMACEQLRLGKGTVTVYEPLLVVDKAKYHNMILNRTSFDTNIDISGYDLVTGIFTCGVTEDILKSACRQRKNFYIAMCGCSHLPGEYIQEFFYRIGPDLYQKVVIEEVKKWLEEYDNGELCIDYLDDKYEIPYPILYNKKK